MVPGYPRELFEAIAELLDVDLAIESDRSGPIPGDDPFADGRADLAWLCSTSLAELLSRSEQPIVVPVGVGWVPLGEPRGPVYFGSVVVRGDDDRTSLEQLGGARIGLNDEISLSGNLSLRFALRRRGLEPDGWAALEMTGGHRVSLDRLKAGEIEATVVDSIVLSAAIAEDPSLAKLKVIERLGPWPVPPLVIRADLSGRAPEFGQRLLEPPDDRLAAALRASRLSHFAATSLDDFAPVIEAMDLWA